MLTRRRTLTLLLSILAVCGVLIAAGFVALGIVVERGESRMAVAEQHLQKYRAQLSDSVSSLCQAYPDGRLLAPRSAPPALRVPGLKAAYAGDRHVTLVVNSSPDVDYGFRIWAGEPSHAYDDQPTSMAGVYRFRYCDDYPESATNRPQ